MVKELQLVSVSLIPGVLVQSAFPTEPAACSRDGHSTEFDGYESSYAIGQV